MPDVEIHWPDKIETAPLLEAAALLRDAGVDTACMVQPVRRGIPLEVLVFVASPVLEPFLKAVFEKVGGDAYAAVRRFVSALLDRDRDRAEKPTSAASPAAIVFESTQSRAQFVFTPGLPEKAYRAAIEMDPGTTPARWVWDHSAQAWLQFEHNAIAEGS